MSNLEAMSPDPSQSGDSASNSPAGRPVDPPAAAAPDPAAIASGAAANDTIPGRILRGAIPCDAVYADDLCLAFRDVNPQAPVHLLVIPKTVIPTLNDILPDQRKLIGGMLTTAAMVMRKLGHSDFRTVCNCGAGAQQTVFHLHLHVLAGRSFTWPPG